MSTLAWILIATLYLVLLWTLGITTFRRGHYVLFFAGIVFPVLWVVGAVIPPKQPVAPEGAGRYE